MSRVIAVGDPASSFLVGIILMYFRVGPLSESTLLSLIVASTAFAQAPAQIQTGRYTSVAGDPTTAQIDPLNSLLTMTIPGDITSVGTAMDYLLQRSGYRLAQGDAHQLHASWVGHLPSG